MPSKKLYAIFKSSVLNQTQEAETLYLEYVNNLKKQSKIDEKLSGVEIHGSGTQEFEEINKTDIPIVVFEYSQGKRLKINTCNTSFAYKLCMNKLSVMKKPLEAIMGPQ